jgi:SSS family solute:Na+ symporter
MIQRYLTAKSDEGAKRNAYIFGAACVPVWCMFHLIGVGIWGFYQLTTYTIPAEIASKTDQIFPYFIMTQLPAGVTGLVLAALLASAMSTLDGGLNSVATVFVNDLFSKIGPLASDKTKLFAGRLIVVIIGLFSLAIAVWLTHSKGHALVLYFTVLSILAGGILGLFLLGFLTKAANIKGAVTGIISSIAVVAWATMTKNDVIDLGKWNYDLHPYLIGLWSHVTVFVVGYFASFLFKKEETL